DAAGWQDPELRGDDCQALFDGARSAIGGQWDRAARHVWPAAPEEQARPAEGAHGALLPAKRRRDDRRRYQRGDARRRGYAGPRPAARVADLLGNPRSRLAVGVAMRLGIALGLVAAL